jgi:hypothetical protein
MGDYNNEMRKMEHYYAYYYYDQVKQGDDGMNKQREMQMKQRELRIKYKKKINDLKNIRNNINK